MLIDLQQHAFVLVSHDLCDAFTVSAMIQGVGRERMAQVIRAEASADTGPAQGVMPCPADGLHRTATIVDDELHACCGIRLLPAPQQGQKIITDRDAPGLELSPLPGIRHTDQTAVEVNIQPAQSKKLAGADARPHAHAQSNHPLHMLRSHSVQTPGLLQRGRVDALRAHGGDAQHG